MNLHTKALLAVMVGNGIFGFSFLFSKTALQTAMPSVMLAMRFTLAFLVLNLVVLAGKILKKKDGQPLVAFTLRGKPLKDILILAMIQPVIYFFAESYGIKFTSSAFAGTLIAVVPIAGVMLDVLIMHTKVGKKQVLCAIASVIGVAVTTIGEQDMQSSVIGVIMLLIAVAAGSLFIVYSKRTAAHFNPLERTYVMFEVGCITYLTFALVQCRGDFQTYFVPALTSPSFWGSMGYLAVISSVVAFLLINFGSTYATVSEVSLFANFTTVISIVAGVVILHEKFTLQQVIGAVLILGSVYISSVSSEDHKK